MSRRQIIFMLLVVAVSTVGYTQAQDSTTKTRCFKFYPVGFVISQLPYCSDIQVAFEKKWQNKHSIQVAPAVCIPKASYLLLTVLFPYSLPQYALTGFRTSIAYRYNLQQQSMQGMYIGVEFSGAYYFQHPGREKTYGAPYTVTWQSDLFVMQGIMTNSNFTFGYEGLFGKKLLVDVSLSVGYRYHYFWRHYDRGNLELDKTSGLYKYYKRSPIGGSLNIGLGGFF